MYPSVRAWWYYSFLNGSLPLTPTTLPDSVKSRNCCHTSKDVDNRPCAPQNYYLWHWHMCFANETNYLQFYFDPQPHMRGRQRQPPPPTYSSMLLLRHIQSLYNRDATNIFYSRPNFPHPSLGCYPRLGPTPLPSWDPVVVFVVGETHYPINTRDGVGDGSGDAVISSLIWWWMFFITPTRLLSLRTCPIYKRT